MKTLSTSEVLGDMGRLCYRTICKTDVLGLQSHVKENLTFEGVDFASLQKDEADILRRKFTLGLDESNKLDSHNYTSGKHKFYLKFSGLHFAPSYSFTMTLFYFCFTVVFVQTTNSNDRLGGDLLKKCFSAIFLTICLRFAGYFQQDDAYDIENGKLNEIEQQVASLILRHLQSVSCNAYGINQINGSNPRRLQIKEIGSATYPTMSTINHSCNSNIHRFTMGNTCIVKTLREIKAGEEILDSYGPHFASNSLEDRIRFLDGQYLFCCDCQPCIENWLVYTNLPKHNPTIKCPQCDSTTYSACGKGKYECSKCSTAFDMRKIMKTTKELEKKFQEAKQRLLSSNKLSALDYKDIEGAIAGYANAVEKIQKWPSQSLIECQETLKLCWNLEHQS